MFALESASCILCCVPFDILAQVGLVLVEKVFLEHAQQLEEDWSEYDLFKMEGGGRFGIPAFAF